jgi:PPM family protein phosphatase
MADVQGLYTVAVLVIALLSAWVVVVLVRAPTAADESAPTTVRTSRAGSSSPDASETSHGEQSARPSPTPDETKAKRRARSAMAATVKTERTTLPDGAPTPAPPGVDLDVSPIAPPPTPEPLPSVVLSPEIALVAAPAAPAAVATAKRPVKTMLGLAAPSVPAGTAAVAPASSQMKAEVPVVVLAPMRSRLDSHPEIQDSPANATVIVMPEASAARRPPMVLVSAVGRGDPLPERSPEAHSIVPRHHLFVFADGSGKKVGMELASSVATQALTVAFDQDEPTSFPDDPKLSARANRVRRAVLLANRSLLQRARTAGYAGLSANLFAAHFSPSNDELFVAHVGANRVYRVRAGELTRLTTPHGDRFVGMNTKVEVEVVAAAVEAEDLYLFCSDGLARALGESELSSILGKDPSLEKTTAALILAVKGKDNTDNVVAMAVRVELAQGGSG